MLIYHEKNCVLGLRVQTGSMCLADTSKKRDLLGVALECTAAPPCLCSASPMPLSTFLLSHSILPLQHLILGGFANFHMPMTLGAKRPLVKGLQGTWALYRPSDALTTAGHKSLLGIKQSSQENSNTIGFILFYSVYFKSNNFIVN